MMDVSHLWYAIYGNIDLKRRLISDIENKKLLHAYIIEGPRNSGKLMLSRTIAAALANTTADVKKITAATCPDVLEISLPDNRKTIGVDTVRQMKLDAVIKPNDLESKIFIVNEAHLLTMQAQNALLKLIEEPPRAVYIFLLCENAATLLPTIRSRAPILRMQVFSPEELSSILLQNSPDAEKLYAKDREAYDVILRSSGGAYGEALLKIVDAEMKIGDLNYTVLDLLTAICERNRAEMRKKIESFPPTRDGFYEAIYLFKLAVRDIIAYRSTRGDCDYLFPKCETIGSYAGKLSLDRLLKIFDLIVDIEKNNVSNPNIQTTKTLLYTKLCLI